MSADLEGKVILVTGAGSGIGEACAKRIAAGGARVAVVDRDKAAAERVAEEIASSGGEAVAVVADVAEEDSVAAMIKEIVDRFGHLDGAVNNAGVSGAFSTVGRLLARRLAPRHARQPRRRVPVRARGDPRDARQRRRRDREHGVRARGRRLSGAGRLRDVQARADRADPHGRARPCRRRHPGQRGRPGVHPHAAVGEDDGPRADRRDGAPARCSGAGAGRRRSPR